MKDPKKIVLLVGVFILLAAALGTTFMLTNGDDPLSLFNLRASNPEDEIDPFLADLRTAPTTPTPRDESPSISPSVSPSVSPTTIPAADGGGEESLLAYNSTSPTVTPGGMPLGLVTPDISMSPTLTDTLTPSPTEFIEVTGEDLTPTVITELPQSGIAGNILTYVIGGGALILVAFFL